MNCFFPQISTEMSPQICNELWRKKWQKYDAFSVPKIPGIYAIGEKEGTKPTELLYVGRAKNIRQRLQQHKSRKRQPISKLVASKFEQNKEQELRIKYVYEKDHQKREAAYMDCLAAKTGHRPTLNKRRGDGGGRKVRSSQSRSLVNRPSNSQVAAYSDLASICEAWYGK